ncbi:MAG: enoyl-CoA hydratase/isomerase family protein [Paracoccaceae bacterium]
MADILIRTTGRAGRITLNRPEALNALTYEMCSEIEAALDVWRDDDAVALVIIDAAGERAFCAGGDIQEMYASGTKGDYSYGRRFWADEYRLNAKIAEYPKPYVALMQGFTMGGGVGVSCHGSHRIVGETSSIAMPECGIGLVPDVGGSLLLSRAPGYLGAFYGITGARMNASDAIHAGFADVFVAEMDWADLIAALSESGDVGGIEDFAAPYFASTHAGRQAEIDLLFGADSLAAVEANLKTAKTDVARAALEALGRNSPLSMAVTFEMIRRLGRDAMIRDALAQEYRYTWRAMEHGDFLEGIRAAIIDKDRSPNWRHGCIAEVPATDIDKMLAPLGAAGLDLKEQLA